MENFEFLFRTDDAWIMTRNTLLYNFVFIVLGTVLAIAVAIILNEVKSKGAKQLYQTVILIPYLISMVIVSYLAFAFLSTSKRLHQPWYLGAPVWRECRHRLV